MDETDWHFERRFGLRMVRGELSFFHRVVGTPRPRPAARSGGWGRWALPLLATAGVAMAVPATRPANAPASSLTLALDAAQPTPHLAPSPLPKTATVAQAAASAPASAPQPRLAIPQSFFEETAPDAGGLSQSAALASALSTGEATDWVDARTGKAGVIVVGDPDERGCRDVVVMTRADDGRNANAARRECDAALAR